MRLLLLAVGLVVSVAAFWVSSRSERRIREAFDEYARQEREWDAAFRALRKGYDDGFEDG